VLVEPEPVPLAEPIPATLGQHLASVLHVVLGTKEITPENLGRLEALARTAQRAEATKQRISARLRELQDSVDNAGLERDIAYEELAVEQRERAVAEEQRAEAERRLRYVQQQLIIAGRADVAWTEPELDVRDIRPDTFVDLLERLVELEHVRFTGDDGVTLDLDKYGSSRSWAGKTWDALLALDDYARISVTDGFAGDVTAYLADTRLRAAPSRGTATPPPNPGTSSATHSSAHHESSRSRLRSTRRGGRSWVRISRSLSGRRSARGCTTWMPPRVHR
jgi:hypothetical protein